MFITTTTKRYTFMENFICIQYKHPLGGLCRTQTIQYNKSKYISRHRVIDWARDFKRRCPYMSVMGPKGWDNRSGMRSRLLWPIQSIRNCIQVFACGDNKSAAKGRQWSLLNFLFSKSWYGSLDHEILRTYVAWLISWKYMRKMTPKYY